MKIIPAIDLMDGKVVRLYKGDPNQKTIYSEDPLSIAKKWEENGEHLVDIDVTIDTQLGPGYICSATLKLPTR